MTAVKLADLSVGYTFAPFGITISEQQSKAYRTATGSDPVSDTFDGIVHPLQLDAAALANLICELGIVEQRIETVHAGQQLSVHSASKPGEAIVCVSTLRSNNIRRGSRWATIQSVFTTDGGEPIAESSSTLILLEDD